LLAILLALEVALFAGTGENFWSTTNVFEITRLAAEAGLLAFGLTLVIKTGGIDLSVGSMMGLSAVAFGAAWAAGWPLPLALLATIALGSAGGLLHSWLIARFNVPPLIVTLGTFSLYRGLAEAATGGYASFTGFPAGFLRLGQGYLGGWLPAQSLLVALVFGALWLVLHLRPLGREITAVGFNAAGARFAGIRTRRVLLRVYVICGSCAALAGLVYVARIGQAKADAGTGYELFAIAAVVLGGASLNGGRGTLHGTLLGLLCLVVLQNGLRLSGQPSEIAGICVGLVLLLALGLNRTWNRARSPATATGAAEAISSDSFLMKNSHVALIIAAILTNALLIAGSNLLLARSLISPPAPAARTDGGPPPKKITIAVTPKAMGDPYFVSCRQGADEAAAELGVNLLWDAPTDPDPARQSEIVEGWITRGVDVIAASAASREAISTALEKAQRHGIKVITWDSDARPEARGFFVNEATAEGIGTTLADEGARLSNQEGSYAIITAELTAANQNEWIDHIKARMAAAYPKMKLAAVHPCDGQRDKAMAETRNIVRAYPEVKVIIAICSPAVPGAAEALKQESRRDVKLTGLTTPNLARSYMHEGWVQSIVLWNTVDLGYLTVLASNAVQAGKLTPGTKTFAAGRLGSLKVSGDQVLLGKPFVFTRENIDQFKF
jgi:rhamnose transport system permease protein